MTAGIIFLEIGLILMFSYIYVEKNTVESWHETSYPRDERGRIINIMPNKIKDITYCDVCSTPIKSGGVYTLECHRKNDLLVCKKCSVDIRNLILKTL